MVVGEPVYPVAGRYLAEPRTPEGKRVDQRFTEDDFFRDGQRRFVPHPAQRAGQVQVIVRPLAQVGVDLAPVHLHYLALGVDDRDYHRAVKVLVPALADDAGVLKPASHFRAALPVLLR